MGLLLCSACANALVCGTTLDFDENGGARLVLEVTIPDKAAGILRGFFINASAGLHEGPLDEEAVRRAFLMNGDAWTLEEYNVYTMRDARRVRIQAVTEDATKALNDGRLLKGFSLKEDADTGDCILEVTMPKPGTWNGARAANARRLMEMLDGLEMTFVIQAPDTMLETTGERESLERCRWHFGPETFLQSSLPEIRARWQK